MDGIMALAGEYDLFVVEDIAQAFGARWKGRKLGAIGTTGCFSFFPSKNLGGFGDGGMVSTQDDETADLVRMLLKHGGKDKYNVDHIGYNARLDTLQAAVLLAKFKYIDEFTEKRREIAEKYNNGLKGMDGIILPLVQKPIDAYHVYHQYTVQVSERDKVQSYLKEQGIATMVYYHFPLHKMRVFEGRCKVSGDLRHAEDASASVLSLPVEPLQDISVTERVVDALKSCSTFLTN
jgi:dTDP-4-amino-4,6-dideoxygalactose transaminase